LRFLEAGHEEPERDGEKHAAGTAEHAAVPRRRLHIREALLPAAALLAEQQVVEPSRRPAPVSQRHEGRFHCPLRCLPPVRIFQHFKFISYFHEFHLTSKNSQILLFT